MNNSTYNQIIIYHDETKEVEGRNFKGHILFFVPLNLSYTSFSPLFGNDISNYSPHDLLYKKVIEIRDQYNCNGKLHFSEISGKYWNKYDLAYRKSIEITADALRQKRQKEFNYPLFCKFAIIFYPKGADWSLYGGDEKKEQKLRHDETLFRMLLKGAAHFLYDNDNQIEIKKIITDGFPSHRNLDNERIIQTLFYEENNGRTPLREYVSFSPNTEIVHLPSNHKEYSPDSSEYKSAIMLQLADLLLGAVMRSCYHGFKLQDKVPNIGDECIKRDIISSPIKEMLDKYKRGKGFIYSGHFKSYTISEVKFSKENIVFSNIHPKDISFTDKDSLQMNLFV